MDKNKKAKKDMLIRAANNAYNVKHNGYLSMLQKEMKEKLENEYQKKKDDIFEAGKKEGYKEGFEKGKRKASQVSYDKGFAKGWDQHEKYGELTMETTFLLALVDVFKFGTKRLLDTVDQQNENIKKLNNGKMKLSEFVALLESKEIIFRSDVVKEALATEKMIEDGRIIPYFPKKKIKRVQ